MAVKSKDLGGVSAYAAAVNRGYTGTRKEFEELMASYATVAEQAAESAAAASAAAEAAQQAGTSAGCSATAAEAAQAAAQSAANLATQSAASAQTDATSASGSATAAAQSAAFAAESQQTTQQTAQDFEETAQQVISDVNAAGANQKELARRQAQNSESWAVGQRDGDDVGVSDPTYHNNSKWYAQQAGASEQSAGQSATDAASSAQSAAQSAAAAAESARTLTIDPTLTQSGQAADSKVVGDTVFRYKEANPADYNNLLSKIPFPCSFSVPASSAWVDKPVANKTFIFTQFRYSSTFMFQIAYGYGTFLVYYRIVKPSDGTVIYDWTTKQITIDTTLTQEGQAADAKAVGDAIGGIDDRLTSAEGSLESVESEILNNVFKYKTINPATYNNQLAEIPLACSFSVPASSAWVDKPVAGKTFIFTQFRYSSTFMMQIAYQLGTFAVYYRIVNPSTGAIAYDWTTTLKNTVYYAIGDSITAGSYSDDEGAHVARNAAWSYPNQIKRMYGIKVTNLGVPGAKITEFPTQAASVQSDATLVTIMGGVNDYGSSTASIGTISDTSESGTIIGALKSMIETIATTAPNARIVLISPIPQKAGTIDTKWSIGYQRYNFTFEQLYAAFKAVAELYNVELIDGTHNGPVNIINISAVLKDATHPTKDFHNTLSDWMAAHIM